MGGIYMDIKLKFNTKDFIDMINKMAIPTTYNEKFIHNIIYPRFYSLKKEDEENIKLIFEWIVRTEMKTWVVFDYEPRSNFRGDIRIPIDVKNMLTTLDKCFKDTQEIYFFYDTKNNIQRISGKNKYQVQIDIPVPRKEIPNNVTNGFPGEIDEETGDILLKDRTKYDIFGTCEKDFFEKLFTIVKYNKEEIANDYNKEKTKMLVYNFIVNGQDNEIEGYTNRENLEKGNVISIIYKGKDIKGYGELHYTNLLQDVVGVLSPGTFEFHTTNLGPFIIKQESGKTIVRYQVPPAAMGTYKLLGTPKEN
jgi:hypothetical protein